VRRSLFHFDLPESLIATEPPVERDGARLLVLGADGSIDHRHVRELDELLPAGALVVVNDTRVVPARLLGHKRATGGKVEILLLRKVGGAGAAEVWRALGRSSKGLKPGAELCFADAAGAEVLVARVVAASREAHGEALATPEDGLLEVEIEARDGTIEAALERVGHVPLPPYMKRADAAEDRRRYQTVFARSPGAVAAPTAGLHLSEALLSRLEARGIEVASVTLHVGLGTFQPVSADDLDDHPMHAESYIVSDSTAAAVARARERGAPVVAIGTTVVRTLESAADPDRRGHVRASAGETRLLIQPGYPFRVVDELVTNFHLPESTLLALVSAFAGREHVLAAYRAAVEARYRFFSYGDAMLLRGRGGAS
jgi:S-adenosylmethionine:tRNA ribosyltransferase-isomerase